MRAHFIRILFVGIALLINTQAIAKVQFHWQAKFSATEQQKLREWIEQTDAALTSIVGEQPFVRHIHLHRLENAREPVPWAHTERGHRQSVHFYVDPSFSKRDFLSDWTAPHELSHLVIPYVGERYAWFAEGFASYMQYQVMQAMGVLSASQARTRYRQRFEKAERRYDMHHLPFNEAAPKLREQKQYPTMYWGGAIYFKQVDDWLRQHTHLDLSSVLKEFVACCRMRSRNLRQLIKNLDKIATTDVFAVHMQRYRSQLGFPNYRREPPSDAISG